MKINWKRVLITLSAVVVGNLWGCWVDNIHFPVPHTSHQLTPVKECPAADKNCNPYDTPENRAIFNKKNVVPAPAKKP